MTRGGSVMDDENLIELEIDTSNGGEGNAVIIDLTNPKGRNNA